MSDGPGPEIGRAFRDLRKVRRAIVDYRRHAVGAGADLMHSSWLDVWFQIVAIPASLWFHRRRRRRCARQATG